MALALASMAGTLTVVGGGTPLPALTVLVGALQLVQGVGAGMVVSPNHSQMLDDVPPVQGSAASAIGQLGQRLANSFGVAGASVAYFTVVYGSGWTLSSAPASSHTSGMIRASVVAAGFLLAALAVALVDLARQRGAARASIAVEAG
jgi:hypothetical protein